MFSIYNEYFDMVKREIIGLSNVEVFDPKKYSTGDIDLNDIDTSILTFNVNFNYLHIKCYYVEKLRSENPEYDEIAEGHLSEDIEVPYICCYINFSTNNKFDIAPFKKEIFGNLDNLKTDMVEKRIEIGQVVWNDNHKYWMDILSASIRAAESCYNQFKNFEGNKLRELLVDINEKKQKVKSLTSAFAQIMERNEK